jgi:hypothetical protein
MYAGNASVVTFLMRFPVLIAPAIALGIVTTVPTLQPAPPLSPPPVVAVASPAPAVPTLKVLPPVESLCPPADRLTKKELAKLTTKERGQLKAKGCIKG